MKNPTASAGFEPANLGTKSQHATSRPPKPLSCTVSPTLGLRSLFQGELYLSQIRPDMSLIMTLVLSWSF